MNFNSSSLLLFIISYNEYASNKLFKKYTYQLYKHNSSPALLVNFNHTTQRSYSYLALLSQHKQL